MKLGRWVAGGARNHVVPIGVGACLCALWAASWIFVPYRWYRGDEPEWYVAAVEARDHALENNRRLVEWRAEIEVMKGSSIADRPDVAKAILWRELWLARAAHMKVPPHPDRIDHSALRDVGYRLDTWPEVLWSPPAAAEDGWNPRRRVMYWPLQLASQGAMVLLAALYGVWFMMRAKHRRRLDLVDAPVGS